jgi:hypothetical protein
MMDWIRKQLRDIFTEPDGKTICPIRVIGIFATLQGIGLAAFDVLVQHAHFDLQAYGVGLGATLAALGLALGMKKDASQ